MVANFSSTGLLALEFFFIMAFFTHKPIPDWAGALLSCMLLFGLNPDQQQHK